MKKIILIIVLLFLGCQGNSKAFEEQNATEKNQSKKIIIPLYFYDKSKWDEVANYKEKEIVILNPSNGPGDEIDVNYQNLIEKLNKNGNMPIGYVYTKWGNRNIEEVKNDIDKWIKFYPGIKGFFIDEASENESELDYYKNLYLYIKSKGNFYIVLNPGVYPDKKYFDISDNIVVFEDDFNKLNSDVCTENPSKSSIIVYDANKTQMENVLKYKCKNFYVTDDTLPNPYDTLPSYFDEEIKLLK